MAESHYVNNEQFLKALVEWKKAVAEAEEVGDDPPQVPNYVGECILKIATHLSYKSNFINYSYRDDMILDGVENCLMYIHNFDPSKSNNPFAYFTQIIYYAFLRKISKEKKQSYIKQKMLHQLPFDGFDLQEHDDDGEYKNAYLEYMQSNNEFDDYMENKRIKRKNKKEQDSVKKQNNLEEFIKDDE